MYKINSLKRLNKSDLIKIGQNSNLETYKCTKVELINKLVDAGLCESPLSSGAGGAVGGDCSDTDTLLPVDLQCDFLYYERLVDAKLPTVPNCSFLQLYTYLSGGDEGSVKALDRAVKHASAGDVTSVKVCQVRKSSSVRYW